jgi:hypothetical protein
VGGWFAEDWMVWGSGLLGWAVNNHPRSVSGAAGYERIAGADYSGCFFNFAM